MTDQTTRTVVHGASDDLLEIRGHLGEEFYIDQAVASYVAFSGGVLLRVTCDDEGTPACRRRQGHHRARPRRRRRPRRGRLPRLLRQGDRHRRRPVGRRRHPDGAHAMKGHRLYDPRPHTGCEDLPVTLPAVHDPMETP